MMTHILAVQIDGDWVIKAAVAIIGAIIAGAGGVWLRRVSLREGEERAAKHVVLQDPMPTVPVKRIYSPPTYYQHHALEQRVSKMEHGFDELRRDQQKQFKDLMEAGQARAERLSDKMDGMARAFHSRVDDLIKSDPTRKAHD